MSVPAPHQLESRKNRRQKLLFPELIGYTFHPQDQYPYNGSVFLHILWVFLQYLLHEG
jgi:hypothetical protein